MKDKRRRRLWVCIFVMAMVLAMTGTGCRSGVYKEEKEKTPEPCLAGGGGVPAVMGAAASFDGLSCGVQPLMEEISSFIWNKKEETMQAYWDGMDNGETNDFFDRMDLSFVFFSQVNDNIIPVEIAEYFAQALEEGRLLESLREIEAEYELLDDKEKKVFDLPEEERGIGIALYYPAIEHDNWYRVSLTEEKDDIIVEHVGEDGCTVNYFFWNIEGWHTYSDVPMRTGGQAGSKPYFIEWDGENYLAIPYWDKAGENIIGVVVYMFDHNYGGRVLAVGKNSDSSICITMQACGAESKSKYLPFNATKWPIVVRY